MEASDVSPVQRRTFLMVMAAAVGGVLTAAAAWPLLRFLSPVGAGDAAGKVEIAREQVPVGAVHFFQHRGRPAVVLQQTAGQFIALSAVCTHLGCVISWEAAKGEFLCPCHGGRFSSEGQVLGGPPPSPLESLPVVVDGGLLIIG
ncbi:MAG: ubiquinol-cytochrome c reductase iron-sulfur subunit [Desulfuromonadales bacterium]|nr:ubiquinol-cytochrome c reductase iron-sulfur subunit [Desulfuromonadales bacterium]